MAQKPKNEEKFYTPQEVAVAVLKKAEELIKARLAKANTSHEVETGEEPHNDEAEAPEYLASADIENSGAHGEKKAKKGASPAAADKDGDGDVDGADAMQMADKDGDGDVDGEDAMEAQEEASGEDLDDDKEAGEAPEHKAKIEAAAKSKPADDSSKEDKIKAVAKAETRKDLMQDMSSAMKAETEKCGDMRPSLKKFMLKRKMKKAANSDEQAAAKQAGAPAPTSPAEKVKNAGKLEMEKNKPVEKLMGIAPKAGK